MRSVAIALLLLLLHGGCAFGAGPVIGVGAKRGAFWGVEVGGGLMVAQAAATVTSHHEIYVRGEATLDVAGIVNGDEPRVFPGARLGGGYSFADHAGGMFVAGGNVSFLLRSSTGFRRCDAVVPAGLFAIDARYVGGEWQLVFAPRLEGHQGICNH